MEVIGYLLVAVGMIGSAIGSLWFLITAFSEGILWGLGIIFLPFVSLIFLIIHWDKAKDPFFLNLLSAIPVILGAMLV